MAKTKISEMPLADPLEGTEFVEVLQDGANRRLPIESILASARSAYDLAVQRGFIGTLDEYLASLEGPQGIQGIQGIPGTGSIPIPFTFSLSMSWVVQHNQNSFDFIETIYDTNRKRIYANVEIIDENSFKVEFTQPQAGSVKAIFR